MVTLSKILKILTIIAVVSFGIIITSFFLIITFLRTNGEALSGWGLIVLIITVVGFLGLFFSLPILFILGFVKLASFFESFTGQIIPTAPTTMICPTCSTKFAETDTFCPTCGRPPSIKDKRGYWTLKKGIILFFGVWMVSTIISSLLFFPEVSGEINNPTFSGMPSDRTERTLFLLFLLFLLGLLSSFMFVMIPFTIIIVIIWEFLFLQKKRSQWRK